jgi:hypothetical protein
MLNLDSFLLQVSVQKLLYSRRRITVELFHEFSGLGQHVSPFGVGVVLLVKDANKTPPFTGPLQNILKTVGLGGEGLATDQVEEGKVFLFVGPKP